MPNGGGGDSRNGAIEWARIAPGKVIVATSERAWLHHPSGYGDSAFSSPMGDDVAGSAATTKNLLDAAVGAGQRSAPPRRADAIQPPMTLVRWVWRLAGYYHTTHATPRLMTEVASRYRAMDLDPLACWAEQKAVEERGHDELALRDIRALGYDPEAVVLALSPPTSLALVRYFTAAVYGAEPERAVGYSYALERLALTRGRDYIERIGAVLPPGQDATRCLRVHSGVGSDAAHVAETVEVVAILCSSLRTQIALAAYEATALCYVAAVEDFMAEDALKHVLATCASDAAPMPPRP